MLNKLQEIKERATSGRRKDHPVTPDRDLNTAVLSTLKDAGEALLQAERLQFHLEQSDLPSPLVRRFKSFCQGTQILLTTGAYAEGELARNKAAEALRKARSTAVREISRGGVITVKDARHRITVRKINNEVAARRVIENADTKRARIAAREVKQVEIATRKAEREARARVKRDERARVVASRDVTRAYRERINARFGTKTAFLARRQAVIDEPEISASE
jgi:hypothetical protein